MSHLSHVRISGRDLKEHLVAIRKASRYVLPPQHMSYKLRIELTVTHLYRPEFAMSLENIYEIWHGYRKLVATDIKGQKKKKNGKIISVHRIIDIHPQWSCLRSLTNSRISLFLHMMYRRCNFSNDIGNIFILTDRFCKKD